MVKKINNSPDWASDPAAMSAARSEWSAVLTPELRYAALPTVTVAPGEDIDLRNYMRQGDGIEVYVSDIPRNEYRFFDIKWTNPHGRKKIDLARTTFWFLGMRPRGPVYNTTWQSETEVNFRMLGKLMINSDAEIKIVQKSDAPVELSSESARVFAKAFSQDPRAVALFDEVHRVRRIRGLVRTYAMPEVVPEWGRNGHIMNPLEAPIIA